MMGRLPYKDFEDAGFLGRGPACARLAALLRGQDPAHSAEVLVAGPRGVGKTALLASLHRSLFVADGGAAPVYFDFPHAADTAEAGPADLAERFLTALTAQYVAFLTRDEGFALVGLPIDRLERMLSIDARAASTGLALILRRHREYAQNGDATALFRNAASAPGVVGANTGTPPAILFDSFDAPPNMSHPARDLIASLSGSVPLVVAARDERALDGLPMAGPVDVVRLEPLDDECSARLLAALCRGRGLVYDAEAMNVAAGMLGGVPAYIHSFVEAAASAAEPMLGDVRGVVELYIREVTTGAMGRALETAPGLSDVELEAAHEIISGAGGAPRSLGEDVLASVGAHVSAGLVTAGVLESRGGEIRWCADPVIRDHVEFSYNVKVSGKDAEEVRTRMLYDALKRAYGRFSSASHTGPGFVDRVTSILREFNGQRVQKAFFFDHLFSEGGKDVINGGAPGGRSTEEMVLPELVGVFDTRRWEPCEAGPMIVLADGFERSRCYSGAEAGWLVGIKPGTSPVNLGDVEAFLRRTSTIAANLPGMRTTRWLAAEGGFTPEASERLYSRGVLSTGMCAVRVIEGSLAQGGIGDVLASPEAEFEVMLPSAERAELVAASAASEICAGMGFDDEASTEVRTALVEACINAFEHGGGKGAGVRLRFATSGDRLEVHVINRGVPFAGPGDGAEAGGGGSVVEGGRGLPHRRGWGIELMRSLMDSVRFDRLKWGTRIVMVKYLDAKGEHSDVREA